MIGVLTVRDDGSCETNGYCTVNDGGIVTICEFNSSPNVYRVIERVTDDIVKIIFR